MIIKDNKIAVCTANELYTHWLTNGWDDVCDFYSYKRKCIEQGTKIVGENE